MTKWLALIATIVLVSCTKDSYHYPNVKEEFFTAYANADSILTTIITDDGRKRQVIDSDNAGRIAPDSLVRLLGYYEELSDNTAKVHSFLLATAPLPVPYTEYADSVATAPLSLQSAWMGHQYINMLFNIQSAGRPHRIAFLLNQHQAPDSDGLASASFSIHHDDSGDARIYESRAYTSLPLYPYLSSSVRQLDVKISYLDYGGQTQELSFVYKP